MSIERRIAELGLTLPDVAPPVANYVPFTQSGAIVHISGQLSSLAGEAIKGDVGGDIDVEAAVRAAHLCGLNLLAQFRAACEGDWARFGRLLKLGVFVQAAPGFDAIPQVANGCSDLMAEVLGDSGRHARSAVGVFRLPFGCAVEVDAAIELR
ncbi:Endoribonuclease L-PSP superfamily [uncultured Sphingopyxis sp.]|uniref:Endoribonuclease L-PSP superfamily n=1 Tax=uncultured Sphingopyxis sp. TaxID=310581 RepID=A0A1Y5PPC8_9SPHN|nr:RidA family protein [uncultured Sphingopyxis sp.]SBV31820.1 Endoribonuclease L-PSP superfamily [uncultured Sphingopyxis sp.]